MSLYSLVVSVHVLVALLAVGPLVAIPLGAHSARRLRLGLGALGAWAQQLFRLAGAGMVVAFLSGALLDYIARGAYHYAGWFRLAGLLLAVTAVCQARARAALKQGLAGKLPDAVALRRIELWGSTAISAVAAIAVLMEWKPF